MTAQLDENVDSLYSMVSSTERVSTMTVCMDGSVGITAFQLPAGWNVGLKEKDDQDLTDAVVGFQGREYRLTKEAILDVCAHIGLPPAYVLKTPGSLIANHLNYWATHSVDGDLKVLASRPDSTVLAVMRKNIIPFSNVDLLDTIREAVEKHFGDDVTITAEPHSRHSINLTSLRLSIRDVNRTLPNGDVWQAGVQMHNSLTGKQILSLSPLPNDPESPARAMVSQHAYSGFNRKQMGQDFSDVQAWIERGVGLIRDDADHDFDVLESLPQLDLGPDLSKVLADVFKVYSVPLRCRQQIIDHLTESKDTTYYGIIDAITLTANDPELPDKHVTTLMEVAGDVATTVSHRCHECLRVQ